MSDGDDDPIAAAWRECHAARPEIDVSLEQLRAYVDARRPAELTLAEQVRTYCISDLFLACACIAGLPAAIAAFEREFTPAIDATLKRWDRAIGDDTRQRVCAMLLVDHAGRGPLLATYSGRGALDRWVRVVTAREAGKSWRAESTSSAVDDQALLELLAPGGDPAVAAIRQQATDAFRKAFVAAAGELERRERTALRLHLLDGLTIDDIAPLFHVHRATVARWIAAAKQKLLEATRQRLMDDLAIGPHEVDSLIRLVHSQIELTEDLLRSREPKRS